MDDRSTHQQLIAELAEQARQVTIGLLEVDDQATIAGVSIHARLISAHAHLTATLLEAHDMGVTPITVEPLAASGRNVGTLMYRGLAQQAVLAARESYHLGQSDADYDEADHAAAEILATEALAKAIGGRS